MTLGAAAGALLLLALHASAQRFRFGRFGTERGVSVYDSRTVRDFTHEDGLGRGTVWGIEVDQEGRVWADTQSGGVSKIDGDRVRAFTWSSPPYQPTSTCSQFRRAML